MKPITTLLVCLDLTDIDPLLIRYAAFVAPRLSIEKIFFIHVIQAYDLPENAGKKSQDIEKNLFEVINQAIADQISQEEWALTEADVIIKTEDQDAANSILQAIADLDADMVIIGQKSGGDRKGHYGKKIMANAGCDTLFIPEDATVKAEKILCALDFSKESDAAFSRGLDFRKIFNARLVCYYLHDISKAYFPASTQKSVDTAKKKANQAFRDLLARFNLSAETVPCHILPADAKTDEGCRICDTAEDEGAHMIIVGAKGDCANVTTLLGNIAESLRLQQTRKPVLIVKNPKKAGFL